MVTKLCWFFTALDLSQTFVKSLQSKATKFLKSWSGLPRSANTTILFLGKSGRTGLHVTNLVTYWKQMQLVRMDILKRSADPRCNRVYDALLKRQTSWLRKYTPAVEHACATTLQNRSHTPARPCQGMTRGMRRRTGRVALPGNTTNPDQGSPGY